MKKILTRFHIFLSHHSFLYALVVGVGIVFFWRGVWHSADLIHLYITQYAVGGTIDAVVYPWWDGPLSLVVGIFILYISNAFVSSFIGNELILSGLRTEKRMTKETESDVKMEIEAIADIKKDITAISHNLEALEEKVHDHHK